MQAICRRPMLVLALFLFLFMLTSPDAASVAHDLSYCNSPRNAKGPFENRPDAPECYGLGSSIEHTYYNPRILPTQYFGSKPIECITPDDILETVELIRQCARGPQWPRGLSVDTAIDVFNGPIRHSVATSIAAELATRLERLEGAASLGTASTEMFVDVEKRLPIVGDEFALSTAEGASLLTLAQAESRLEAARRANVSASIANASRIAAERTSQPQPSLGSKTRSDEIAAEQARPPQSTRSPSNGNTASQDSTDASGGYFWIKALLFLAALAGICFWLSNQHERGRLTIFSNYTDIAFTLAAPVVFIGAMIAMYKLGAEPKDVPFASMLMAASFWVFPLRDAFRTNHLHWLPIALVAKVLLPLCLLIASIVAFFGNALMHSPAKGKHEHHMTYAKRVREADAAHRAAAAALSAALVGWLTHLSRIEKFEAVLPYFRGDHLEEVNEMTRVVREG